MSTLIYLLLTIAYIILSVITYYQINSYSLSLFFFKDIIPSQEAISLPPIHYQICMQCP